jgi:peroxin-6
LSKSKRRNVAFAVGKPRYALKVQTHKQNDFVEFRSDLIDPALLRPGRFDRCVYIGIPTAKDERVRILEALTRKFRLASDDGREITSTEDRQSFLFDIVGEFLSTNSLEYLTGADFYALSSDAMLNAITRKINLIEQQKLDKDSVEIFVSREDFRLAAQKLVPSVSREDLEHYQNLKNS